jgi:hypothetical protein
MVSASMVSAATIALIVPMDLAPPATALTCNAPEANVDPPPSPAVVPSPSPLGRLPIGLRPRGANDQAPLPQLGPLISALIHQNAQGAAPVQQQAAVVPPGPNPPNPADAANQPSAEAAAPQLPSAADPGDAIGGSTTSLVEWVTGPNGPNKTLGRFGISGTDLGILWDNGDPANRQVLMAFGDTFGYCRLHGQQWRYNVLLRSPDRDLSDGITVPPGVVGNMYSGSPLQQPDFSKRIIPGLNLVSAQEGMIPTAGIAVGKTQYLNFMSIKQWVRDGDWTTNYSAIAMSHDNGQNWGIYPTTVRASAPDSVPRARYIPGDENFQQGAFLQGGDGYLYSFGTPAGRSGSAYLARVPQSLVPDLTKYEYWNADSGSWVPANPAAATPVIPGPVGEMSVQYNTYLKQYLVLYGNGANSVVARTAPAPQGPWSGEQTLVSSGQMPGGVYAPYLHPWSTGKDLYYTLSLWSAYDVMLMHTALG